MSDALIYGRRFRILNIIDDYNREALAIEPDYSFTAQAVVRVIKELIFFRDKPKEVRVDNGSEFFSKHVTQWCKEKDIRINYIQPGIPAQNAFIE
jgi:putative transposase